MIRSVASGYSGAEDTAARAGSGYVRLGVRLHGLESIQSSRCLPIVKEGGR